MNISRDYGVLIEEEGIALRGLFLIDPKGILRWIVFVFVVERVTDLPTRQITVNDLPVGRSVDETIRLIKAFQFTVRLLHFLARPQFSNQTISPSFASSSTLPLCFMPI
jgi:alkyl hydroperoxide reductase subunit AhpC